MKNKKIVCISDTHGKLPDNVPDGDILVITGDVSPMDSHKLPHQAWWVNTMFNPWLDSLPFDKDHIALVAGNHDFVFQDGQHLIDDLNCQYLQGDVAMIDGLKVYGYPYCPKLSRWAFYRDDEGMEDAAKKIPDDTDILLTHCPPYSILDEILNGPYKSYEQNDKFLGCRKLKKRLNDLPDLKLHVFGHIHTSHKVQFPSGLSKHKTVSVNASIMDDWYHPIYDIITVEI